jgi:hypothetical protein
MTYRIYIDCFSSLDDLPKKKYRDLDAVESAVKSVGRISVFEATNDMRLARTLDELEKAGRLKRLKKRRISLDILRKGKERCPNLVKSHHAMCYW